MSLVVILLVLAGLSEAVGRVLPLVARRPGVSRTYVAGLLLLGGLVQGAAFALWPPTARALAELVHSPRPPGGGLVWTPGLVTPLVLAAVVAFPLLGPLLHLLLLVWVGAGMAGPLAAATGLGWWAAAGCVAVSGAGIGVAVEAVRRWVVAVGATTAPEAIA